MLLGVFQNTDNTISVSYFVKIVFLLQILKNNSWGFTFVTTKLSINILNVHIGDFY